jgi:Sulfotransferase family
MNKPNDTYKIRWQPPPRPEWVSRLNAEGDCMDGRGVIPLDEASLIYSAQRATGLSDFGDDQWRQPFRMLIRALEEEAGLNLMGRLWARHEILLLLQARLQVEDTYKRHPEIEEQQIAQPIIILGQGRSGTSFLQNTLTEHPDNKSLLQWEAMFPCPPPNEQSYATDARIELADNIAKRWNRVIPTMESMHEWRGHVPQECCEIMALTFMAPSWLGLLGQVPSYDAYMMSQDYTPAMSYHKRVLKLLQWQNPRKHWVLKDTQHMDRLGLVLKTYPDACFIWIHRDPVRAFASVVSLIGTTQWSRCDHPFSTGGYEFVTDLSISAGRLEGVIEQLEAGVVPDRQIYNLLYRDFVADPVGSIKTCYRHFGIEMTATGEQAMVDYLKANPRSKRPVHQLDGGSPEDIAAARAAYARYQDYFGIPDEG